MARDKDCRVLVVVPAYNEAANLPQVISDLKTQCPGWDIIVVDDGSKDHTSQVAGSCGALVLSLPFNLGIGGAVQSGLIYADRHDYDICLQIDGDGQHGAAEALRLVEALRSAKADAVVGSRFLSKSGFQSTFARRIGISLLRTIINVLTGQRITDPTSGQRAFGKQAIALLAANYPQEYPEPEVLYLLCRSRLRVFEIPVEMRSRQSGQSSIGLIDSLLYIVKVVLAILIHHTRLVPKERAT